MTRSVATNKVQDVDEGNESWKRAQVEHFLHFVAEQGVVISDSDKPRAEPLESFAFRFLYSCEYDKEFALDTMKRHIAWRKNISANQTLLRSPADILGCDPVEVAQRFPFVEAGTDLQGRPIIYYFASGIDAKGIVQRASSQSFASYQMWLRETSIEQACYRLEEKGVQRLPPYYLAVMDLKGIRLGQANSSFYSVVKLLVELDDWQYPARVDKILLVNAPFFFNIIWKAIRRLAYHTVDKKVEICGTSKADISKMLTRYIEKSQIPKNYGGYAEVMNPGYTVGTRKYRQVKKSQAGAEQTSRQQMTDSGLNEDRIVEEDASAVLQRLLRTVQDFDTFERLCLQERRYLREKVRLLRSSILRVTKNNGAVTTAKKISTSPALAVDSKAALLLKDIEAARQRCESSQAAIKFARNYIEQESKCRTYKLRRLRSAIENVYNDNVCLVQVLVENEGKAKATAKTLHLNRQIHL